MQKIKFDARQGRTDSNKDLYDNPWRYSFTHNFKVHFKRSVLQALANKTDISITSRTADIPPTSQVMEEFNERMRASIVKSDTRQRFSEASYHVTQIEYKESFAFYDPNMATQPPPPSPAPVTNVFLGPQNQQQSGQQGIFCRMCGTRLPSDSKFCNKCGAQVT